jgi:hypothetical protein
MVGIIPGSIMILYECIEFLVPFVEIDRLRSYHNSPGISGHIPGRC